VAEVVEIVVHLRAAVMLEVVEVAVSISVVLPVREGDEAVRAHASAPSLESHVHTGRLCTQTDCAFTLLFVARGGAFWLLFAAPCVHASPLNASAVATVLAGAVATDGVARRVKLLVAERGRGGTGVVAAVRGVAVGDANLLTEGRRGGAPRERRVSCASCAPSERVLPFPNSRSQARTWVAPKSMCSCCKCTMCSNILACELCPTMLLLNAGCEVFLLRLVLWYGSWTYEIFRECF